MVDYFRRLTIGEKGGGKQQQMAAAARIGLKCSFRDGSDASNGAVMCAIRMKHPYVHSVTMYTQQRRC